MAIFGTIPEWIQAACAVLALIGLYYYTRYTKEIRNATLVTQRAAVEPLLVCSIANVEDGQTIFEVSNEGNGMALNVQAATIPAPRGLGVFFDISEASTHRLGDIRPGSRGKTFPSRPAEKAMGETVIVQAEDVNGDLHQLQIAALPTRFVKTGAIVSQARVSDRVSNPTPRKRAVVKDENERNH